jgi:glycosyltransferase involved in cell wall biosynthesis
MNTSCDCIIPFYNEGSRVLHVVESIKKVKNISHIVVVDDGSTSKATLEELKAKFPQIIAVRLHTNSGKAKAVKEGVRRSAADYVLLLDGDLTNIKKDELENAISRITNNPKIDMIILRRVDDITSNAWARQDIVTSGQRILKTLDLKRVFQSDFSCYQLEVAMNAYMIKNMKQVYWMPLSIHGPLRMQKWGWKEGWRQVCSAVKGYFTYHLVGQLLWQSFFFCKNEAPKMPNSCGRDV